jgi:hypothetical protein
MVADPPRLTGSMIGQHRSLCRERFGDAVVGRCLDRMPAAERDELEQATALSWVPFPLLERFYGFLSEEVGRSVDDLHTEIVRAGVERNARTLWRALLRITSDNALIRRAPVLFSKGYDRGFLHAVMIEPGVAEMTVSAFPDMDEFVRRGMRVAFETMLTVAGRQNVRAELEPTRDGAIIRATWRR